MFRNLRSTAGSGRRFRAAGLWIIAGLALTLRPGPFAAQDYHVALSPAVLSSDELLNSPVSWRTQRAITGALLTAAAASELYRGPHVRTASWFRRAALGVFLGTRAADAQSLPGRWPYDTFIEVVLVLSQWPPVEKDSSQHGSLTRSLSRAVLYLPYTQAGLSKLIHGFEAWVRRGDANQIYHSHLKASTGHPFADEKFDRPVRVLTRAIPFLELLALPLALLLPGKWRALVPCCTSIFHLFVARTWNISFWQAPAMQWLHMSVEKPNDFGTILFATRGK